MMKNLMLKIALPALIVAGGLVWWWFRPVAEGFVPPIPALEPQFTTYEFEAEKGIEFEYPTGSTVKIPADALVDEDGNIIKGKVQLQYRELHSVLDVFASGVPLEYDSADSPYHLQTAGMFDIKASQGESKLQIAEGKKVDVKFASFQVGDQYNFYQWSNEKKTWIFQNVPTPTEPNPQKLALQDSANLISKKTNLVALHFGEALDIYFGYQSQSVQNPLVQQQFKNLLKAYQITYYPKIEVNMPVRLGEYYYPAFSLLWERLDSLPIPAWVQNMQDEYLDTPNKKGWKTLVAEISPESKGTYWVGCKEWFEERKIVTKTYQDTIYQYNKTRTKRRIKEIKTRTEQETQYLPKKLLRSFAFKARPVVRIADYMRQKPAHYSEQYAQTLAQIENLQQKAQEIADVFRPIEIGSFGTYNYDYLAKFPEAVVVEADFENKDTKPTKVYYISAKNKVVIQYEPYKWKQVTLQPDETARIFAVMPDYTIAYYDPAQYNQLDFKALAQQKEHLFVLKNDKTTLQSQTDLKKALAFER